MLICLSTSSVSTIHTISRSSIPVSCQVTIKKTSIYSKFSWQSHDYIFTHVSDLFSVKWTIFFKKTVWIESFKNFHRMHVMVHRKHVIGQLFSSIAETISLRWNEFQIFSTIFRIFPLIKTIYRSFGNKDNIIPSSFMTHGSGVV